MATATTRFAPSRRSAGPGSPIGCWPGRGPTCRRRRPCRDHGSTWSARWPGGGTATCAASTTAPTTSRRPPGSSASRPGRSPTWTRIWASGEPTTGRSRTLLPQTFALDARPPYAVVPDIGTAAWISCAGHLPYGQSLDQRADDDASLVWDLVEVGPAGLEFAGHPRLAAAGDRLRTGGHDRRAAVRRLPGRHVGTGHPRHAEPHPARRFRPSRARCSRGSPTTSRWSSRRRPTAGVPGQRLRVAVAGADWPNAVAPPRPVTIEILGGELTLPVLDGRHRPTHRRTSRPAATPRG